MAHVLKATKATRAPKNVIFYDTETKEKVLNDKTTELTLKLGYAVSTVRGREGEFAVHDSYPFITGASFCRWVERQAKSPGRYYVVAHNIGFDLRIVGLTRYLTEHGWKRHSPIMEGLNLMIRYRKGKTTLFIMNNQQLFNSSLADLGASIGVPKLKVDFATATDDELMTYCKRDVEVMRRAWNLWYQFVKQNDLGTFSHTIGSQAMTAFRHRFMQTPIWIHTDERATRLERESYHGGRVECFALGALRGGPFYALDVNSMYPFVMKNYKVPVKLLKYYDSVSIREFTKIRKEYGYIAEATLSIQRPVLPVVSRGRLVFPVGRVRGVFAKPELERALEHADLHEVHRVAVYHEAVAFGPFVDFFYGARQRFKADGNAEFAYFSKIILNSLYGKFGQKITDFKAVSYNPELPNESGKTWDLSQGREVKFRRLDGITEIEIDTREAYNAFPAIASYITAAARARLVELIEIGGFDHTLYCDTDSLFVDSVGYSRLLSQLDEGRLGYLKVEGQTDELVIYGPKRYKFGDKVRSKGIRKDAHQVGHDTFRQVQFESFKGSLRTGIENRVYIHTVIKRLSAEYLKGVVLESGRVRPFSFPAEAEGAS